MVLKSTGTIDPVCMDDSTDKLVISASSSSTATTVSCSTAVFVGSTTTGSGTPVLGTLIYWHCNYLIL